MICELCGRETKKLYRVIIEGVEMFVCKDCKKFGKELTERSFSAREEEKYERVIEEEVLEDDWSDRIRDEIKKRMSRGKKIEEIARELNIKESLLRKILSGNVSIDIKTAKKLEKSLGIKLVKKEREILSKTHRREKEAHVTLGDIVKIRIRS